MTLTEEDPTAAPGHPNPGAADSRNRERAAPGRWPASPLITAVTFGALGLPFAIIVIRFLGASHRVYLPDDLALIDLHTRAALHWHQAVGPFDRFGWNHPGPVYYYVLATVYRHLGIDHTRAFVNPQGRPIPLLPNGEPIAELL